MAPRTSNFLVRPTFHFPTAEEPQHFACWLTFNSRVWQDFYSGTLWVSRPGLWFSPNLLQKIFSLSWEMDIFRMVPSPLITVGEEVMYVETEEAD